MRILIVDDSQFQRVLLKRGVEAMGHACLEAAGGHEALQILEKSGPLELALIDWNMPEMNARS